VSGEFKLRLAKELNTYYGETRMPPDVVGWDDLPFHRKLTFISEAERVILVWERAKGGGVNGDVKGTEDQD